MIPKQKRLKQGKTAPENAYLEAYTKEALADYRVIDALEAALGYAVDPHRLIDAAGVLACPVKRNPPCWQHGRVIYAVLRRYLADNRSAWPFLIDIGTAKGFSAVVMAWALKDAGRSGSIVSLDIVDPAARVARNSIAELRGLKTLSEFVEPYLPRDVPVHFLEASGGDYLAGLPAERRIHFAFVDGAHDYAHVSEEANLLSERQCPGDIIIFDDLQIPGVARAVKQLRGYEIDAIQPRPNRIYAIARKR